MFNRFKHFLCGTAALLGAMALAEAQVESSAPTSKPLATGTLQSVPSTDSQLKPATTSVMPPAPVSAKTTDNSPMTLVQASTTNPAASPATATKGDDC